MSMPINQTQRSILNKLIAYLEKKYPAPTPQNTRALLVNLKVDIALESPLYGYIQGGYKTNLRDY